MLLKELFANDVTRDIPPVVYFHEQDPAKVAAEVGEYIITGGYGDGGDRQVQSSGIHEQFVRLLGGLAEDIQSQSALPASWISGFYGSGKSSFAKLLGLALDGMTLPDGQPLAEALLQRDDSPKSADFRKSWRQLNEAIAPIAVVFDVGAIARDDEQIHSAIKRQLQKRLGYCDESSYVADHELKLEEAGEWEPFLQTAEQVLGEPWETMKQSPLADDYFSEVMHAMNPTRYEDAMSWYSSRAGETSGVGTSAAEVTADIEKMLARRAAGKTLFVVVDEVSQYIFQNTGRMLALQSFVSALGQRLKGRVWLLATGQQKLEDSEDESNISKLKDRFPPKLRVHLAPTNIRDVVHKRLLKKKKAQVGALESLFETHRSDLSLYGYECEQLSKEQFLEVYPLLPGYVDLLMQITSNLRSRSTKAKGDDHAIRGLLQLLGELFREQNLGEQALGTLITIDNIFDVQQSALDNDVQMTLTRIFANEVVKTDALSARVAKAVALLELVQEQMATTPKLVAQCLYDQIGQGNQEGAVSAALERLRELNLLSYSEKTGYKIQSSAGQEWARERDRYRVAFNEESEQVSQQIRGLLGTVGRPSHKGTRFQYAAYYSDGRQRQDERLQVPNELAVVTVDFRYTASRDNLRPEDWIKESDYEGDRIIWVVSDHSTLRGSVKELVKSKEMLRIYGGLDSSLSSGKKRELNEERSRENRLTTRVKEAVADAFLAGSIYFRGRQIDPQPYGETFGTRLLRLAEALLPDIYSQYVAASVTPAELAQLLEPKLSGISNKFIDELGIFKLDAGKYEAACTGDVPSQVKGYVLDEGGVEGGELLRHFGGPPYGYPTDVVKACLAGLLRAGLVSIRPDAGAVVTSVQDPGARDLFVKDRDLKRATVLPPSDKGVTGRDRIAICRLFETVLDKALDRDNDTIADAVFANFPQQIGKLRELEARYNRLPARIELPKSLQKLQKALEDCMRSRQVEPTLLEVKRNVNVLRDGIEELEKSLRNLTDEKVEAVRRAQRMLDFQVAQLAQVSRLGGVEPEVERVRSHFEIDRQNNHNRPWEEIDELAPALEKIEAHYQAVRLDLIEKQEQALEEVKGRLQHRQGYFELSEAQAEEVLRPLRAAASSTTKEAIAPTLLELKGQGPERLHVAREQANRRFDEALAQRTGAQVVELNVTALLANKEISSVAEMDALVNQMREQVADKLAGDETIRVRLV
ncbi:MAG: BREX system P-loop protein BrxC [Cyanobacteria bacterium J06627_28]